MLLFALKLRQWSHHTTCPAPPQIVSSPFNTRYSLEYCWGLHKDLSHNSHNLCSSTDWVTMSEESAPRKRSRFDQTEPEPRKTSRFDRRSRSPVSRNSESRRSRSPLSKSIRSPSIDSKPKTPVDPAAAAAAAAAKINAQIEARRGIQHVDVPPIQSSSTSTPPPTKSTAPENNSTSQLDGEVYIADGDYIKDVEVNDLRNRYTLTKGSTQKMVIPPCSMLIFQAFPSRFSVPLICMSFILFLFHMCLECRSLPCYSSSTNSKCCSC